MGSRSDHGLAQAAAQALQTAADAVVELDAAIAQGNAAEQRGIGAAGQADGLAGQRLEPGAQGLARRCCMGTAVMAVARRMPCASS